jgi:hypothetical protein
MSVNANIKATNCEILLNICMYETKKLCIFDQTCNVTNN